MKTHEGRVSYILHVTLLLAALVFASCTRIAMAAIKLPTNPILTGGLGFAVVKDAYVRLKGSPSESAPDIDHLRRGSVFALEARVLGSGDSYDRASAGAPIEWYRITSEGTTGWVDESQLDVYASRAQAEKAAAAYR
jgi:hypothetical protein